MKNSLAIMLALVFLLAMSATALAIATPAADPSNGGTVSVSEEATLEDQAHRYTANPNPGYSFLYWRIGGEARSDIPQSFDFYDNDERSLTAVFQKNTYNITRTADPSNGGSITASKEGPYEYGDAVTLTATPNSGFTFTGWSGALTGTSSTQTLTVYDNLSVTANFLAETYAVNVSVLPAGSGTANGSTSGLSYGSSASVSAAPSTGYTFDGWYEGESKVSSDALYSFVVTSNRDLVAKFAQQNSSGSGSGNTLVEPDSDPENVTVQVYVFPAGAGTATGGGTYPKNTAITLSATANSGYVFDKWSIGEEFITINPSSYTVTNNVTIYANFKQGQNPRPHPPAESYTITYMPGDYSTGPTHAITYWDYEEAHAADYLKYERPGYSQTGWSYHSDGDELIYHFNDKIPYKQDMTLYPYWVRNSKPLTLTVYTVGNGTVYLNGSPLYNGWHWALEPGQSLTFTFYPKPNHYVYSILFGNWYRSGQYGNQYTVSYNDMGGRDQSMTVRFESIYHPPKTGDESNIALWAALGILAAGGLIAVALISKKKK